jgi:hypothetical protein
MPRGALSSRAEVLLPHTSRWVAVTMIAVESCWAEETDIGDLTFFHRIRTEAVKCILMRDVYRQAGSGKGSTMSDSRPSITSAQDLSGQAASGGRRGNRLVRRTFLIALALVCNWVAHQWGGRTRLSLPGECRSHWGAAAGDGAGGRFQIQQFVQDIEHTLRAPADTGDCHEWADRALQIRAVVAQ